MKLTAINTGNATITVHKTGCGDVNKTTKRHPGASVWTFEAASQHDALRECWSDFVEDWDAEGRTVEDMGGGDTKFLACCKDLPATDPEAPVEPQPEPVVAAPVATGTVVWVSMIGAGGQPIAFAKSDAAFVKSFDDVDAAAAFAATRKTGYVRNVDDTGWLRRGGRTVTVSVVDAAGNVVTSRTWSVSIAPHLANVPA